MLQINDSGQQETLQQKSEIEVWDLSGIWNNQDILLKSFYKNQYEFLNILFGKAIA